jgi:hypothetical protein
MSFSSFCLKYKRPLCLVVFILLGFILVQVSGSIKEGLDTTDWTKLEPLDNGSLCTRMTTCSTCTKSYLKFADEKDNIRCAWSKNTSNGIESCVSSDDKTPIGDFMCPTDTSNTKPGCSACPKLKLLDTPTWISEP